MTWLLLNHASETIKAGTGYYLGVLTMPVRNRVLIVSEYFMKRKNDC